MKQGWTYKKLGEVCDFEGGSQPPKSEWINHPEDGYVRMLQIRDFTKSRNAEIEYVKVTKKLRLCKADDILIGRYGASVGKILTGLAGAYNVAIIKSIPNEELIRKDFIRRYFESSLFQSILFKVCTSRAAQAGFSKDDIKDELIPLPPLSEQQRIVERLDSAFAHIDELKANAEKQVNEARALFHKALSKAMEPKDGWEEKKFGEVCYYHKEQGVFKDMKYLGMEHMESSSGRIIGHMNSNDVLSSSFRFYKGDVLYGRLRPYLQKVYVAEFDGCCSTEVFPIRSEIVVPSFIKYWLLSDDTTNKINATSAGCRMPRGNMNEVKMFPFSFPKEKKEQQRIVARLDSLSEKVRKYEEIQRKVIAECDALKQALLRKVFE